LPISPAAHYFCGGIVADLDGASSLPGLWAAGETACNGVMGANRLASNSLLDGMVFAPRVIEAIERGKSGAEPTGAMRSVLEGGGEIGGRRLPSPLGSDAGPAVGRAELQDTMTRLAGVLRSAASLAEASSFARRARGGDDHAGHEVRNLGTVAQAVIAAARAREESRGAHARIDFPDRRDDLRLRFFFG
jgi:L-aspartate oxidase